MQVFLSELGVAVDAKQGQIAVLIHVFRILRSSFIYKQGACARCAASGTSLFQARPQPLESWSSDKQREQEVRSASSLPSSQPIVFDASRLHKLEATSASAHCKVQVIGMSFTSKSESK